MESLAHWYSLYSAWIAIPLMGGIAVYFHMKNKTTSTLILAIGLCLVAVGTLTQMIVGVAEMSFDVAGNIISSSGPQLSWYLGSFISSTGLLVTVIGFARVANKLSCTEE